MIRYSDSLVDVDWILLTELLKEDAFDNGRSPEQLRISFENSAHVCFAFAGPEIVGKGRVLSDGICNAYLVDLWTRSDYRKQGIAAGVLQRCDFARYLAQCFAN